MDQKGDLSLKPNHTIDGQTPNGARRYDRKIAGATVVVHYPKGSSYDEHGVLTPNTELAKRLAHKLESSGAVAILSSSTVQHPRASSRKTTFSPRSGILAAIAPHTPPTWLHGTRR